MRSSLEAGRAAPYLARCCGRSAAAKPRPSGVARAASRPRSRGLVPGLGQLEADRGHHRDRRVPPHRVVLLDPLRHPGPVRGWLEGQEIGVRDGRRVQRDDHGRGRRPPRGRPGGPGPPAGWQRPSCADGSKGPRLVDWALIEAASPGHWLMARRSLTRARRASWRWRTSAATRPPGHPR